MKNFLRTPNQKTDISRLIALPFLFIVIALICNSSADAVPVIPNLGILKGTVREYCLTSSTILGIRPEQSIYKLVVSIEEIEDVEGCPNFLKGREGQNLTLISKEKISIELFGKRVKAEVEYRGDERGGSFWIKNIEIIESKEVTCVKQR